MNLSPISMRSTLTHPPSMFALPTSTTTNITGPGSTSATTITNIMDIETSTTTLPSFVTPVGEDCEKSIVLNGTELQAHMNGTHQDHPYVQLGLASSPSLCCKNCNCDACDIRFTNCGCLLHARCVPLPLLVQSSSMLSFEENDSNIESEFGNSSNISNTVNNKNTIRCPFCHNISLGAIEILPLAPDLIEQAVELRRAAALQSSPTNQSTVPTGSAAGSSNSIANGDNDQSTLASGPKSDESNNDTKQQKAQKKKQLAGSSTAAANGSKRKRLSSFGATMAEASFLLLSSSYSPLEDLSSGGNSLFTDGEFQRTGRWSDKEMEYVDFLLNAFDRGQLPLPNGVRLNDFLCQIFLCKSSRLTKKLKNARLSARTYQLAFAPTGNNIQAGANTTTLDYVLFSSLQEKFLLSVTNEASQLELRFHLSKTWRMQFANLCSQLSCKILNDKAWLSSLEQMEFRASEAEETIRRARRRRMGLALKADAMSVSAGVFFAGMPVHRQVSELALASRNEKESTAKDCTDIGNAGEVNNIDLMGNRAPPQCVSSASLNNSCGGNLGQPVVRGDGDSIISSHSSSFSDVHINTMLELAAPEYTYKRNGNKINGGGNVGYEMNSSANSLHDFAEIFDDLIEDSSQNSNRGSRGTFASRGGSFLDSMIDFVEMNNLPFQHVDVWVPSLNPAVTGGGEGSGAASAAQSANFSSNPAHASIRLCHAGHATRSDINPALSCQLYEYGEYSIKYSFAPGRGLPGRTFTSFQSIWDCRIDEANEKHFERAGGAKIYGVKTAVGIPLQSKTTGCIIIAFYSVNDIPRDDKVMEQLQQELARLRPEPKWKLVVDNTSDLPISSKGLSKLSSAGIGVIEPGFPSIFQQNSGIMGDHGRAQVQQQQQQQSSSAVARNQEIAIAQLLGECMPLANDNFNPGSGSISDLDSYVSLRLLLLRPSDRRSADENVAVEIILKSYEGYNSVPSRWSSTLDLVSLIVKDWSYLRTSILPSYSSAASPTQMQVHSDAQIQQQQLQQNFAMSQNQAHGGQLQQQFIHRDPSPIVQRMSIGNGNQQHGGHSPPLKNHQCHVMELPKISTFATTGVPVRMPFFHSNSNNNIGSNNTNGQPIPYLRDRSTSYPPSTSMTNLPSLALSNNLQMSPLQQQQQQLSLLGHQQQQQLHQQAMYTLSTTAQSTPSANYQVDDGSS